MNSFFKILVISIPFILFPNFTLAQGHGGMPSEAVGPVIILLVAFFAAGLVLVVQLFSRIQWIAGKKNRDLSEQGGGRPVNTTLPFKEGLMMELVMATEDEFQIVITDEEVRKCSTPNLLTDLVYSKMKKSEDGTCSSMRGLYVVRRILMEKLDVDRKKVQEETRFDAIISRKHRSEKWQGLLHAFSEEKKVYAPLESPMWIKKLMYILIAITFCFVYFGLGGDGAEAVLFSSFIWLLLLILTLPFKKEFPINFQKVKDLMGIIDHLDNEECGKEEIYSRVVLLASMQLGIKEEEILPNDHFIDRLGMG